MPRYFIMIVIQIKTNISLLILIIKQYLDEKQVMKDFKASYSSVISYKFM